MKRNWRVNNEPEWEAPKVERRGQAADRSGAMQPGVEVSDFCRREGLNPVLFYKWKKQLLGSASRVFEEHSSKPSAQDQRHEAELARLKNVIAEITAENLELKKGLSG